MSPLPRKQSDLWSQVAYYTSLGFILPAAAVVGYGIGWLMDRRLHTSPVLSLVFTMLGAAGGFIEILQIMKRAEDRAHGNNFNVRPGSK
jgi:F0F1-type ATP synthase assembly protein I